MSTSFFRYALQDWEVNSGNVKARLVLVMFRAAQRARQQRGLFKILSVPWLIIYRVGVEWLLGIELPWNLQVGARLRLFHGVGLVVNDQAILGSDVVLRHCTTIGVGRTTSFGVREAPTIGDRVDIGSNVVILGPIRVGDDAVIGAGTVVVRDVPNGAVVVGNPGRVIRIRDIHVGAQTS